MALEKKLASSVLLDTDRTMTPVLAGIRPRMAGSQKMQEQFSAQKGGRSRSDVLLAVVLPSVR
jgi:hypothetical protein